MVRVLVSDAVILRGDAIDCTLDPCAGVI